MLKLEETDASDDTWVCQRVGTLEAAARAALLVGRAFDYIKRIPHP